MKNYLNNFRLIFIFSIPLMLFLSAILGWILSKGAYGPIRQMIRKTNELTAENLNTRLAVNDSGDELAQLSVTLNNMIERLEKSFTSLKQFTSDASHELRTPLTILRGQLEVALEKQRESKEYETTLKQNLDEVIRLQFIVDELLILSQLESGKLNIVKENINIIELITDTVSKINYLAKKKNIKVILNIKLDENNHNASINGDKAKLQNVFFNLLDNSIKYSFENSDINCTISHNYKENAVEVAIEDKGVGIAPGDIDKIFDRFYRADTSRTRDNSISLGLGLSIAKKIVEIHGGKLKVYSQLGAGSTFYVIFPQA